VYFWCLGCDVWQEPAESWPDPDHNDQPDDDVAAAAEHA
jgi:hypothetical protein